MHCKKNTNNRWVCVADGPRNPLTGVRKQISRNGQSRKEAETRVLEALQLLNRNFNLENEMKFTVLTNIWFDNYRYRGVKDSTLQHRKYCMTVLTQHFGQVEVRKITGLAYQNMLNTLANKNVAISSIKGIHNVAKMIFSFALHSGLILENPTSAAFIPRKQLKIEDVDSSQIEAKFLNTDELKLFLNALDDYNSIVIKTILYVITFTGMRPGEVVSLFPSDVDFEKATITINKTTYRKNGIKGEFELTPPKTLSSIRVIDIDDFLLDMLKEMMDFQFRRSYKESDYLFKMTDGFPPTVDYLRTVTTRLGEKIQLKKKIHTYMLRHTHVSLLAEAGVDLNYIMERVGHKNSKTTTDIYLHVTQGVKTRSKSKMHTRFSDLLK